MKQKYGITKPDHPSMSLSLFVHHQETSILTREREAAPGASPGASLRSRDADTAGNPIGEGFLRRFKRLVTWDKNASTKGREISC